jgi:hypothetical protein
MCTGSHTTIVSPSKFIRFSSYHRHHHRLYMLLLLRLADDRPTAAAAADRLFTVIQGP